MTVRGYMDEVLKPLSASELMEALRKAIEQHGDLPVQIPAWWSDDGDCNDAAAYIYPYDRLGNSSENPDYFYIHGTPIRFGSKTTPGANSGAKTTSKTEQATKTGR